ncbi:MAG: hypothetical protein GY854_27965 [Deltaproteobacteria bacterium]|nr:hypothetical protein [Deltaproteobacteria bacterium]
MTFNNGLRVCMVAAGTLIFLGCSDESGGGGDDDCTVETADDGSVTLKCGDESVMITPGTDSQDGASGQDGSTGQDGADGTPGADGADGADGSDGAGGTSGSDGADGDAGPPGRPGTDGQDGSDGADGGPGQNADECTVVDNGDGTSTQTCPDGTSTTWWTGYSGRIFYRADADNDGYEQLYLTQLKGDAPTSFVINHEPQQYGEVNYYIVSEDGDTLVFDGDLDSDQVNEVYYVDLSGDAPATPVKLNSTLVADGDVSRVSLSANGETLVYTADQETDGVDELYYVDLSGASPAAAVKISGALVTNGDVWTKPAPQISDDGNRAIYAADSETDDLFELFYVDLSGATPAAPVKLNDTLASNHMVYPEFHISGNGQSVAYLADRDTLGIFELFYVDLSGASPATPVKISGTLVANGEVFDGFKLSADGRTVIYRADQQTENVVEIYYVDLSGPTPATAVRLNGGLPSTSADIDGFVLSRDADTVLFYGDQETDNIIELFMVDLGGASPTTPVKVSGELVVGRSANSPAVSANGQSVAYRMDPETDNIYAVYFVDLSGEDPGLSVKINTTLPVDATTNYCFVSQDGDTVVYVGEQEIENFRELYLVSMMPNGQPAPRIKLNVPMIANGDVTSQIEMRPL